MRTVEPMIAELENELEEASATLGAARWQTIRRVMLPPLAPALLTGLALAFARGVGEYGSVIFIAGNLAYVSEIAPLLIVVKLEEYDYAGATAIAAIMLAISFVMLLAINFAAGLEPAEVRRCLTSHPPSAPATARRPSESPPCARAADRRHASAFLGLFLLAAADRGRCRSLRAKVLAAISSALADPDARAAIG